MEIEDLYEICRKVQTNSGCHLKYTQKLIRFYKNTQFEEFILQFMKCLETVFVQTKCPSRNVHVERFYKFASKFCAKLSEEGNDNTNPIDEQQTHPFLKRIINEVLKYHNLDDIRARYNACEFIMLLLKSLNDDIFVDNDTCNDIQEAMLERIRDCNANIRLQAVTALLRLQDPTNCECPVITAYIHALCDQNPMVRRLVIDKLAPTALTLTKIVEHTRDLDRYVRASAFSKCASVPPSLFKIADRQAILNQGFEQQEKCSRKIFMEVLLPKWLTAYNGDFLTMLKAIKLDAFEDDIKHTEFLSKNVLEVYFGTHTIVNIIEQLPINEEKIIANDKLSSEAVLYWFNLHTFLRANSTLEDYVETIVPELTQFCLYIERIVKEKCVDNIEEWQYLETQYIIHQLFEMVGNFDFCDEVGKTNLHDLILRILKNNKFEIRNITQMVKILHKMNTNINQLVNELYDLITDIREKFVSNEPSAADVGEREFKLAGMRVKLNIISDEMDDAVQEKSFQLAEIKRLEFKLLEDEMNSLLNEPLALEKNKVIQDDDVTTCKCLDIIISVLQLPVVRTLPLSLKELKDELVASLINTNNMKIHNKLFTTIALCAQVDLNTAKDNLKLLCTPCLAYRVLPDYDKLTLITSIKCVSDLLRIYGSDLFNDDKNKTLCSQDYGNAESVDFESTSCETLIEVIVDMMDEDDDDVRQAAGIALSKLVSSGVMTSPSLISRIMLKWFNPLTEQNDPKSHQMFGECILRYSREVANSKAIIEAAILPTLNAIGNAPRTSPLTDINIENALKVLSFITTQESKSGVANAHQNLTFLLINQLLNNPLDKCVGIWSKFLLFLEPPCDDPIAMTQLKTNTNSALEDLVDRFAKRNLQKYISIINERNVDANVTQLNQLSAINEVDETRIDEVISEKNADLNEKVIEDVDSPQAEHPIQETGSKKRDSTQNSDEPVIEANPKKKLKMDTNKKIELDKFKINGNKRSKRKKIQQTDSDSESVDKNLRKKRKSVENTPQVLKINNSANNNTSTNEKNDSPMRKITQLATTSEGIQKKKLTTKSTHNGSNENSEAKSFVPRKSNRKVTETLKKRESNQLNNKKNGAFANKSNKIGTSHKNLAKKTKLAKENVLNNNQTTSNSSNKRETLRNQVDVAATPPSSIKRRKQHESSFENSSDDTILHTIVYNEENVMGALTLLDDDCDDDCDFNNKTLTN